MEDRDADGNYYAEFSEALELKQVIIGAHSSVTRRNIRNALSGYKEEIETFKARAGFKRFEVVINQNDKLLA